jgi:hypothetical protein
MRQSIVVTSRMYLYSKFHKLHQLLKFILFLGQHSTSFGRSFRPSSGVGDCTYSNRCMSNRYSSLLASNHTAVPVLKYTCCCMHALEILVMDGKTSETCRVLSQKWNKFQKLLHLVGFTIEIYCGAQSYERQICHKNPFWTVYLAVYLLSFWTLIRANNVKYNPK